MFGLIEKVRSYFRKRYLFEAVQKLEKFAEENKLWRVNYFITELHVSLLIENQNLLLNEDVVKRLSVIRISSKFNNITEVEKYTLDFINQSLPFVKGEVKNRPKINNGQLEKDPLKNVNLFYFLEASDGKSLLVTLARIQNICAEVKAHCSLATKARQPILESICKDIFSPLLTILQEIFEVLYDNQTGNPA